MAQETQEEQVQFLYTTEAEMEAKKGVSDRYTDWQEAAKQYWKLGNRKQRTPAAQGKTGSAQP